MIVPKKFEILSRPSWQGFYKETRSMILKFENYVKRVDHVMSSHLREMSHMNHQLKKVGHDLADEQQVQAIIRSFSDEEW